MLKKGILATNTVYVCVEHTDKIIKIFKIFRGNPN